MKTIIKNFIVILTVLFTFIAAENLQAQSSYYFDILKRELSSWKGVSNNQVAGRYTISTVRYGGQGNFGYTGSSQSGKVYSIVSINSNTISFNPSVAFSDRRCTDPKDLTTVEVKKESGRTVVYVTLNRWGNARFRLSNVRFHRERYGYFITGEFNNSVESSHIIISFFRFEHNL